jgi:SagB-type dehydrogenase family enzyme
MRRRRSRRGFGADPLPLAALRDCLFSALAIVGFGETGAGPLPISMTPSGGARNPFEAFVYARHVEGLAPGVYHYAGVDGSLLPLPAAASPSIADLLGGQAWFADAGALILLTASFGRTMWKYPHPGALRVVLLEAGHIAQNLLLTAAWHGLAATPTCAVADSAIHALCGLDPITQAVLHTVAIGTPSGEVTEGDLASVVPNPAHPGWLG